MAQVKGGGACEPDWDVEDAGQARKGARRTQQGKEGKRARADRRRDSINIKKEPK